MKAKCAAQHGFEPDPRHWRLGERQALGVDILRIMRRDDNIIFPPVQASTMATIILAAEWRIELEEAAYSPMSFSLSARLLIEMPEVTFAHGLGRDHGFHRAGHGDLGGVIFAAVRLRS